MHHYTNFQRILLLSFSLRGYEYVKRNTCASLDIYFGKLPPSCRDSWPHASFDLGHPVGVVAVTAESSGNECFISLQKDNNNSSVVGGNTQKPLNLSPSAEANPNKINSRQFPVGSSSRTSEISPNRLLPSLLRPQIIWMQLHSCCSSRMVLTVWGGICAWSHDITQCQCFLQNSCQFGGLHRDLSNRRFASHTSPPIVVSLLWQCKPVSIARNYLVYPPEKRDLFKGLLYSGGAEERESCSSYSFSVKRLCGRRWTQASIRCVQCHPREQNLEHEALRARRRKKMCQDGDRCSFLPFIFQQKLSLIILEY